MKKLNIGMIGYGFMGRTHSNAFSQVNHFFDVPYQPVLKTVCARNAERAQAFAAKWGYESVETDWRKRGRISGYRPDRYRQPQRHARRNRHRRRQGRQDGDVRKAAGPQRRRSRSHGESRGSRRRAQHGLVQLPPRPRRHARQATDRRGPPRPHLPLPRQIPAGLDHLDRTSAGRRRPLAPRRRAWPAAASPAICWRTASIPPCG